MGIMCICLLTDFGLKDNFVGVIKAIILKINPYVKIIDLTHEIFPHNIEEGAFLLWRSFFYFPKNTVFCVVIDPGVGTNRRALAIKTKNYYFVGPDNGILYPAASLDGIKEIVSLENKNYFLKEISSTFHGRDIFAPVSSYLAMGIETKKLGKKLKENEIKKIIFPLAKIDKNKLIGNVLYVDRFGNLVTNLLKKTFINFLDKKNKFLAKLNNFKITKFYKNYQEAQNNELFFIEGSFGFLEISLKEKNAFNYLKIKDIKKVKFEIYKK